MSKSGSENKPENRKQIRNLVENLFRRQYGQLVSYLTGKFGVQYIDLAEDAVQETLIKAIKHWPFSGIPENPAGWLRTVAKNQIIDILRRRKTLREKFQQQNLIRDSGAITLHGNETDSYFEDEQLKMIFLCCHPRLPLESQIAVTLKCLAGFSTKEIARALLITEVNAAQRVVRGKRKIRELNIALVLPDQKELKQRIKVVLKVLYLVFNEGYHAFDGESLIKEELCAEAVYLTSLLLRHPDLSCAGVHALLSLMYFHMARFPARINEKGELLLLSEQDRSLWDQEFIHRGFHHLKQSARGETVSQYHYQAAIASCHAISKDYESTDWQQILYYYNELMHLYDSAIVRLNRAVPIARVEGYPAALRELQKIKEHSNLQNYHLLACAFADMYAEIGEKDKAIRYLGKALTLAKSIPEKKFIRKKIDSLKAGITI